ncbi:hypothetical protein [Sphingomonas fuzhouensis]|uniref:hypothetical protein n=1 Tax=Sphingomonas fuzhouensis TaxID=3106033 RepID=UPI002AFE55C1|nr:hypothetical protein [Sphingomonas sp. SGZ-02]
MLRRHALPLLLIASALPLAACSRSEPANSVTATDNLGVANDEVLANDEAPIGADAALGNVGSDNALAPEGSNAS